MARPLEFTPEQITAAIENNHGLLSLAAKSLKCSHQTVRNYILRYELQPIVDAARDDILDIAEEKLLAALKAGDFRAVAFTLKCLGRDRGWVESTNVNLAGQLEITRPQVFLPDIEPDDTPRGYNPQVYTPPVQPVTLYPPTPQQPLVQTPPTRQNTTRPGPVLSWRPPGTISQESE